MNGSNEVSDERQIARRSCRANGCPCQDGRIVSHRRAAFFAAIARRNGETADRHISPEEGWRLPPFDRALLGDAAIAS